MNYILKKKLENEGVKFKYPPKPGYIVPLSDDRIFRIFCKDKNNRKFVAKLINLVTGIDFDFLLDRMIIIDTTTLEDSIINHYNDQDVIVTLDNTTINLEMSTNIYSNKRKNERTAFKYAGNQYKIGSKYDQSYIFYQICLETYSLFDNDFLINEVNMVNVTSGNYECETNEFKKFHINLKKYSDACYNGYDDVNKFFKFFTMDKISELEEFCKGDDILMDALDHLKSLSHDSIPMSKLEEQELDEYCQRLAIMDAKNDGLIEGKLEGKLEGEKSKQIEIAKNLLSENIDINIISKSTGLTVEKIKEIA